MPLRSLRVEEPVLLVLERLRQHDERPALLEEGHHLVARAHGRLRVGDLQGAASNVVLLQVADHQRVRVGDNVAVELLQGLSDAVAHVLEVDELLALPPVAVRNDVGRLEDLGQAVVVGGRSADGEQDAVVVLRQARALDVEDAPEVHLCLAPVLVELRGVPFPLVRRGVRLDPLHELINK